MLPVEPKKGGNYQHVVSPMPHLFVIIQTQPHVFHSTVMSEDEKEMYGDRRDVWRQEDRRHDHD
jgi:hypothetical protein